MPKCDPTNDAVLRTLKQHPVCEGSRREVEVKFRVWSAALPFLSHRSCLSGILLIVHDLETKGSISRQLYKIIRTQPK